MGHAPWWAWAPISLPAPWPEPVHERLLTSLARSVAPVRETTDDGYSHRWSRGDGTRGVGRADPAPAGRSLPRPGPQPGESEPRPRRRTWRGGRRTPGSRAPTARSWRRGAGGEL